MMITPPEELIVYLSTDPEGDWIHDPDMPAELEESFQKFVREEASYREMQQEFSGE